MAKVVTKPDVSTGGHCMQVTSIQRGTILTCQAGLRGLNHDASVQIPLHRARAIKPVTFHDNHEYFDLRLACKCALVKRAAARMTETEPAQLDEVVSGHANKESFANTFDRNLEPPSLITGKTSNARLSELFKLLTRVMPRLINVGDSTGDHQSSLKAQRKNLMYVSGWRIETIIQGDHK